MSLYTRTGDKGFTELRGAGGRTLLRLRKTDPRLVALGSLDELGAAVGLCVVEAERQGRKRPAGVLRRVQSDLFRAGAMLAAMGAGSMPDVRLERGAVVRMERYIDGIDARLGQLRHFVLPGGCELAARLHLARAIARRAERAAVAALDVSQRSGQSAADAALLTRYLNRLSDLLFALARQANHDAGVEESAWKP
ncbi:MAG: ATP:cob(I)alamin adenosyltransferase [Planctomycetales bacterium 4484_123]|nr:MAG: ATP:cob(I)alamin adenosyltransferase [Planctomycetales bacterium 4484_123]